MAVENVASSLASQISGAIKKAARSTGISFDYLLTTARIESNLNPTAKASTSSAKGLYQFIEQTWLGTVKQDGQELGLGQYANAITRNANGRYEVADPAMRAEIMKLRNDPSTSAMMAGALARDNGFQLTGMIGRRPTEGELYAAHFLGPAGAGKLINAAEAQPGRSAAAMFPSAAGANRNIFYERNGNARSVSEVYAKLTRRFDHAREVAVASFAAPVSSAAMPAAPLPQAKPAMAVAANAQASAPANSPANSPESGSVVRSYLSSIPIARQTAPALAGLGRHQPDAVAVAQAAALAEAKAAAVSAPDTAGFTQAFADANDDAPSRPSVLPLFQAMFTDPVRGAVTQRVASLWTPGSASAASVYSSASTAQPANAQGAPQQQRTLDLFTDSPTDVRGLFHGRG